MKRFIYVAAALLVCSAALAGTVTGKRGLVYTDQQVPQDAYVAYDAGGAANWEFTPYGGPATTTQGTSVTLTNPATVSHWDETTKWLSDGRCVTYTLGTAATDGPGYDIEIWESGGRGTGRALGVALYNSATNIWIADGAAGSGLNIPGGAVSWYGIDLADYSVYGLTSVTKIALWGTGGWLDGLWKKDASGNPYTGYQAAFEDMDGDGTLDNVLHIGGGQFTDDRNWSMAVPEPVTMLVLGGGLLALIRRR